MSRDPLRDEAIDESFRRVMNRETAPPDDELYVNAERTVLVRIWENGTVEVATRETPAHTWGPPVVCEPERGATSSEGAP